MKKAFNWIVWFAAGILSLLFIGLEVSYTITGKENNQITLRVVVVSMLIGIATQIGLFLSPWAIAWPSWYQKIVFLAMLPSIFWLLSQIYYDVSEFVEHLMSGASSDAILHGIEAVVMTMFLLIYAVQAVRVSADFLRKPAAGNE